MGRFGPQLRGPLGTTLLAEAGGAGTLIELLCNAEPPGQTFVKRVSRTADAIHERLGIQVRPLTTEQVVVEWRRSVSAAAFILLRFSVYTTADRFDPYQDYTVRAARLMQSECLPQHTRAIESARIAQNELLACNQLSRLFQLTFVDNAMRAAWLRENAKAAAAYEIGCDSSPRDIRVAVAKAMRQRLRRALASSSQSGAEALALGMDELLRPSGSD